MSEQSPQQTYAAALDSVQLITNTINDGLSGSEIKEKLRANALHLEITRARLAAHAFDFQPFIDAVAAVRAAYPDMDFTAPKEPLRVSSAQAKIALHEAGLFSQVQAVISAMEEPTKTRFQIAWDHGADWSSDSVTVNAFCDALGLSQEQKLDLFTAAAEIRL